MTDPTPWDVPAPTREDLAPTWLRLVDDAAVFPPGDAPLTDAVAAYTARSTEWYADFVGPLVVRDTDLPDVPEPLPLAVVVTGGAGAIEGPAALAQRKGHRLVALEIALRDPDDLAGNARRVNLAVDAARDAGVLEEETRIHVELPGTGPGEPTYGWLAAADVVAEAEHRLKFRTGGLTPDAFPSAETLVAWVDAALDRELPFKCTAGMHRAVRHTAADGQVHHGFVNLLVATSMLIDGAPREDARRLLESDDVATVTAEAMNTFLDGARRWFTSFGSCSVTEPVESLVATGLLVDV